MTGITPYSENFILVWLDQNINESGDLFRSFVNTIKVFSHPDECRRFIEEITDEKLFLIVSGSFGHKFVPTIEIQSQILAIYVYCQQKEHHSKWAKDFSKIKGVYTDLQSIFNAFRRDIRQANNDLLPVHLHPTIDSNHSFLCSLLLKEILLHTPSNDLAKRELIEYSRFHSYSIDVIDQYEKNDYHQITAIEWYTRECFISAMIQRALRLYDMTILNKTTFFIQDLHEQIRDLHEKSTDTKQTIVYYGQGISKEQLEKFRIHTNGLITFDGFLLTTIDRELSFHFAKQSGNDGKLISLLYQIEIDPSKSSTPFIPLGKFDYYHDTDQHILFSFDAIFRINKIEQLDERFWQISLILIDKNDPSLTDLNRSVKKSKGFFSLGQTFFQMSEFNKAKNIFQFLLQNTETIDQKERVSIHRMLGRIYQKAGDFPSALLHYQECMKTQSTYDPWASVTLAGIGAISEKLGNLNQALEYFKRAAENQNTAPSILAFYYISIGRILYKQGEHIEAGKNFQLALKFAQDDRFLKEIQHYLTLIS